MTTIYHVYLEDDDAGEIEGMFDAQGNILGTWSNNDATWRGEYFGPFMKKLGIEVRNGTKKHEKKLKAYWKEALS